MQQEVLKRTTNFVQDTRYWGQKWYLNTSSWRNKNVENKIVWPFHGLSRLGSLVSMFVYHPLLWTKSNVSENASTEYVDRSNWV
jgi:hypothetical protein